MKLGAFSDRLSGHCGFLFTELPLSERFAAAAKAGLNAMTEGLAKAFGPTVRVNTLMAGPFLTDVSKAWDLDDASAFDHLSLRRAGQPSEIVGAALFLASDASSFTTGSILRADGGLP